MMVFRGASNPGLGGARPQRGGGGRGGVRELRRVRGGGRDRGLGGALGVQNQPGGDIPLHLRGGWHWYFIVIYLLLTSTIRLVVTVSLASRRSKYLS